MASHPPPRYSHQYPQPPGPSTALHTAHYASSDDIDYRAKYEDMKKKVKEIELDNDRLHLKCLKTKRNIQRLRLERAILYERVASIPAAERALFAADPGPILSTTREQRPHPVGAQEQSILSPEIHAQVQADGHLDGDQLCIQMEVPPFKHYPRHQDGRPPLAYPQPVVMQVNSLSTKPRSRKSGPQNDKTHALPTSLPPPPSTCLETHSAASRTYPFVLEYPNNSEQSRGPPIAVPGYPSEIRFHQYDSSDYPAHRVKQDFDRDSGTIPKQKRVPEADREYQPDSSSRSPRPVSPTSTLDVYAHPLQHPFLFQDDLRRQGTDPSGFGTKRGHVHHEHQPQLQFVRMQEEDVRQLPYLKKRSHSQMDNERTEAEAKRSATNRDDRDDRRRLHKGTAREEDDRPAPPRVREGDIMD